MKRVGNMGPGIQSPKTRKGWDKVLLMDPRLSASIFASVFANPSQGNATKQSGIEVRLSLLLALQCGSADTLKIEYGNLDLLSSMLQIRCPYVESKHPNLEISLHVKSKKS